MRLPVAASGTILIACALAGAARAQESAPAQAPTSEEAAPPAEEEAAPPADEEAAPPADEGSAADAAPRGNQIVVTAAKREQPLQNVPVAVSAVTAAAIERAAVRDLADLETLVPSLRVTQLQNTGATNFSLRGFGNGANNPGIEPSVGVFVDGVYRSRASAAIADLPDLVRVEVLRGPQSSLFGKNASAGVVALVTRAPEFRFHGNVEASYGNDDGKVLRGYVTGPLAGKLAGSLALGINRRDGFVDEPGYGGRANGRNRWFSRGQLRFDPSETLSFRVIADYDRIDEDCCAVVNLRRSAATDAIETLGGRVSDPATPFADIAWANFASDNRISNWGLSAQGDYQVGPLKVTAITAWRESHSKTRQDSDFSTADLVGMNSGAFDAGTFTQELRASIGFLDIFNAMVGASYFHETIDAGNVLVYGRQLRAYADLLSGGAISTLEAASPGVAAGTFLAQGQGLVDSFALRNTSWSVFSSLDFKPRNWITLTVGANYTRDSKDARGAATSTDVFSAIDLATYGTSAQALRAFQLLPPFLGFPNAVETGRTRDGDWSWNARIALDLGDFARVYAAYSTGFKASSFNLTRDSRPFAAEFAALGAAGLLLPNLTSGTRLAGPEDARSYEIGFKGDWGVVSANLALFRQSIEGFQSNTFTGTGFVLANAGEQSTWGVEFDGVAHPVPGLTLNYSLAWLDPRYDRFTGSPLGDLSGRSPAGIPGISTTLGAEWTTTLAGGDKITLNASWHYESPTQIVQGLPGFIQRDASGAVISYQGAFDAARPFRREVDDLSASLSYGFANGLEIMAWGRNLTASRYLLSIFDSVAQPGAISGYPNQPRSYGVTARFRW